MSNQTNIPAPETIGGYTVHPIASLFPMLEGAAYEELKQSIKEHGQLEPIILDKWGEDGLLLDGRNRLKACLELKIDPWFREYEVPFKGQAPVPSAEYIIAENLFRRHLTDDQRMMITGAAIYPKETEAARDRQRKAGKHGSKGGRGKKSAASEVETLGAKSTQGFPQAKVTEKMAEVGKGTEYAARQVVNVLEEAPELVTPVANGTMPLREADKVARQKKAAKTPQPPPHKSAATDKPKPKPPEFNDEWMDKQIVDLTTEAFQLYDLLRPESKREKFKQRYLRKLAELWGPPEEAEDRRSRPQRWQDAVEELRDLQSEYQEWSDKVNDPCSPTGEKLAEVIDVDLSILDVELPVGFGRD